VNNFSQVRKCLLSVVLLCHWFNFDEKTLKWNYLPFYSLNFLLYNLNRPISRQSLWPVEEIQSNTKSDEEMKVKLVSISLLKCSIDIGDKVDSHFLGLSDQNRTRTTWDLYKNERDLLWWWIRVDYCDFHDESYLFLFESFPMINLWSKKKTKWKIYEKKASFNFKFFILITLYKCRWCGTQKI
jgi:hypothetical protein